MKILFLGRKKHAADMLEWTVNQGIEVAGVVADDHVQFSDLAKRSKMLKIPAVSLDDASFIVSGGKNSIDLVVSYLYWRKIREPLISTPRLGCINFHPAILPEWKGVAGYNIAILNKLNEWGASAHVVDSSIDTGPIIKVFKFNFDYRLETAQSLEKKTQEIQCELYKSVMTDIKNSGSLPDSIVQNTGGRYITKKEMLEMMRVQPGDDVSLKVRAFWYPPHHGAYVEIDGAKYTLLDDFILQQLICQ